MSEQGDRDSIEEILRKDPHILSIEYDTHRKIPEIDYSLFNGEERGLITEIIDRLNDFLNGPYIVDNFESHPDRRKWREEMQQDYDWFYNYYKTSSLKFNSTIQVVRSSMSHLMNNYLGDNQEELEKLIGAVTNATSIRVDDYEQKITTERIEFVQDIKTKVYGVLNFLSSQDRTASK